jgi:hypothetical protein
MSNYFVSLTRNAAPKNGGTIHDPSTKLKVKVVDLLKSKFVPQKGEVSFFVTAGDETLAFETKGYKHHRQLLILQMVAWYCMYLGLMEAQIHSSLPSICR